MQEKTENSIIDTQYSTRNIRHAISVPRDHSCKLTDRSTMQEKTEITLTMPMLIHVGGPKRDEPPNRRSA